MLYPTELQALTGNEAYYARWRSKGKLIRTLLLSVALLTLLVLDPPPFPQCHA